MTTLTQLPSLFNRQFSDFDVLVRNFFDTDSTFTKLSNRIINHPVDIYETKEGLVFEIACTGLDKVDVQIEVENDLLKVSHKKEEVNGKSTTHNYYSGIAKRSFDLGWKVASRFNLAKISAELDRGLLKILVPVAPDKATKLIEIK